ncbi:MAG: hypothetical protein AB1801_28915 [Chloroflexota bacterium]
MNHKVHEGHEGKLFLTFVYFVSFVVEKYSCAPARIYPITLAR